MDLIFCKLKKAQKTRIKFLASLKKLKKHGFNFFASFKRLKKKKRQALLFEEFCCDAPYRHKMKDTELMSQDVIGAVYLKKQK